VAKINLDELLLVEDAAALSDAQIAYLRDNPQVMDLIGDRESLGTRHLWRILVVAIVLIVLSKLLVTRFEDAFNQIFYDAIVDLVYEMGAALIGSVATVIFIEHQQKKQFIENIRFRQIVQRRIDQLSAKTPA